VHPRVVVLEGDVLVVIDLHAFGQHAFGGRIQSLEQAVLNVQT
jgi:hypothetical protein